MSLHPHWHLAVTIDSILDAQNVLLGQQLKGAFKELYMAQLLVSSNQDKQLKGSCGDIMRKIRNSLVKNSC